MAIRQLTEEQTRTMSVEQKDRWWLENVYKGDVPQMTARVVICGFVLGGLLSITNLYVGAKAGWLLGVAITSVILAFVMFKVLLRIGLGTVLEGVRMAAKGKFPLMPVGIGLAFVIPFQVCLAMFFGSFVFWVIDKIWPKPGQRMNEVFVQNQESICAGVIAGAALIGVAVMAVELFLQG